MADNITHKASNIFGIKLLYQYVYWDKSIRLAVFTSTLNAIPDLTEYFLHVHGS